ncbi:MAG: ComEC/Rec2 family competence protein [Patescibacteria group bacterium]
MNFYHLLLGVSVLIFLFSWWLFRLEKVRPILPSNKSLIQAEGSVISPPVEQGNSVSFELGKVTLLDGFSSCRVPTINVRVRKPAEISYGDRLFVSGRITSWGSMSFPTTRKIKSGKSGLRKFLYSVRSKLERRVQRLVSEPEAGLLLGILLGSKSAVSPLWSDIYRDTGLLHVVVASGYNITVLISVLGGAFRPLGQVASFVVSFLGILVFTLMLGGDPPIVRAAILGGLSLWGLSTGRARHSLRALLFAGFVMLFFSPNLIYSLSFQLSFAASLSLNLLAGVLRDKISLPPLEFLGLSEDLFSTFAANLFVFPLISYHFGDFPLLSVLVNVFILWLVPYIMFFGFLSLFLSFLSFQLGRVSAYLVWILLRAFNMVARLFSQFSQSFTLRISTVGVIIYYAVVISLCLWFQTNLRDKNL